jgi:ATP-binding cassette subfamily B protein
VAGEPGREAPVGALEDRPSLFSELRHRLSKRSVPVILGVTALDCGAASLAMVLGYFGRDVALEEVRQVLDVRQGTSAEQILRAARLFGLVGHGVRAELDDLDCLEPGTILHWEFDHFVVFEGLKGKRVRFIDPVAGRRELPVDAFGRSFTGVALILERAPDFQEASAQRTAFRRYLVEVLGDHGLWIRVLVSSLLLQVFSLALPFLTGTVVETILPRADHHLAWVVAVGLAVVVVSTFGAMLVRGLLLVFWRVRLDGRLSPGLLNHFLALPLDYFQMRMTPELSFRLSSTTALRDGLTGALLSGLLDGTLVLSYAALVLWIDPAMGAVVLALTALQAGVFMASWRRQRLNEAEELAARDKMGAVAHDILAGVETIKAQALEGRLLQQWMRYFARAQNAHVRKSTVSVWVEAIGGTLRLASPLVVLMLGAFQVMSGAMSLGTMLALNAVAAGLFAPVANLIQTAQQLNGLGRHVDRLNDVFSARPEPVGGDSTAAPLAGGLSLQGICYHYSDNASFTLRDVSFDCSVGEWVALVGRSGSGKSTLAKLIAGLYPPDSGHVLCDGQPVEALGLQHFRRQIGYVAQRPSFMGQSIRLNIANFDAAVPMERVYAAAQAAGIHDEILQLPMGYETALFNEAGTLSGGQRQRIALARALLRDPRILILDEATSALDALAERQIFDRLSKLGSTRIVIAHRLSTIVQADRIVVVDAGRVIANGDHASLLGTCPLYRELVTAQSQ